MEPRSFQSRESIYRNREARLNQLSERRKAISSDNFATKVQPLPTRARSKTRRDVQGQQTFIQRPVAPKSKVEMAVRYGFRLTIVGVGVSVIAGTLIAFWQNFSASSNAGVIANHIPAKLDSPKPAPEVSGAKLKSEVPALAGKIKQLAAAEPDLGLQTLIVDLDTGSYVDINSHQPIACASTIKVPLLIAFLQDVDAGKVRLDEQLELTPDVLVGESGDLQYQPLGTRLSALETLTMMITISDNTATNMILKRLGGKQAANQRFKSWGLTATEIRNPLPDVEGTNTTSPADLANLLAMVDQGKLISPRSRDRLMDIMRRTVTATLIPRGIGPEARIVHKTGDIRSVVGDAAIVDMPSGKRYVMAALVKRPDNDQRANELIRQVSRTAYEYLSTSDRPPQPPATETSSASPSVQSGPTPASVQSSPASTSSEPPTTNTTQP